MIRSRNFWLGTISLAIIPLLLIDIAQHTVDWTKDVHNEILSLVYHQEVFNAAEKATMLGDIFDQNRSLGLQLILKSVFAVVLLGASICFFRRYSKERRDYWLKPSLLSMVLVVLFLMVKVFVIPRINFDPDVNVITYQPQKETFRDFYAKSFKGKVVYVDFWGVYCGPCLEEFKHFTPQLKKRYAANKKVDFLYICGGNEVRHKYMWREQIKKYNVKGNHIFLDDEQYVKLYNELTGNKTDYALMPWYLIIDGEGNVKVRNAARPSEKVKLYSQIESNKLAQR